MMRCQKLERRVKQSKRWMKVGKSGNMIKHRILGEREFLCSFICQEMEFFIVPQNGRPNINCSVIIWKPLEMTQHKDTMVPPPSYSSQNRFNAFQSCLSMLPILTTKSRPSNQFQSTQWWEGYLHH